jgi:hypothetical protein
MEKLTLAGLKLPASEDITASADIRPFEEAPHAGVPNVAPGASVGASGFGAFFLEIYRHDIQ